MPAAPKLPSSIRVGPYDVKVLELEGSDRGEYFGTYNFAEQEIRLNPKFTSRQMQADTLIHEVLHAVWRTWGVKARREEKIVTAMATGLTQVLRDNPSLRKYLNEALK